MFHPLALVKIKDGGAKHFFETLFQVAFSNALFNNPDWEKESYRGDDIIITNPDLKRHSEKNKQLALIPE